MIKGENEWQVFGIPGGGKTTYLAHKISEAAKKSGSERILVSSFTRAAAKELTGRNLPIPDSNVGTLHAICYRLLGTPTIAETKIKQFNEEYPHLQLSTGDKGSLVESAADFNFETEADKIFCNVQNKRARMIDRSRWSQAEQAFDTAWTRFKFLSDYVDFTDMIELTLKEKLHSPGIDIGIFDEAQDFTPLQLELIRHWAQEHFKYIMIAGDDDQASAPWSMIRTTKHGYVRADSLDPEVHELSSYNIPGSQLSGMKRKGSKFQVQKSWYKGNMHVIDVAGRSTHVTHNHPSIFRFNEHAEGKWCVYLMRKRNSYRVGWCQLIRSDGCFHLGVRARNEGAEHAWILKVCNSKSLASLWESFVAAQFGLSTCIWRPMHDQSNGHYSEETIEALFGMLGDQTERAVKCLEYFGRDINLPMYSKDKRSKFGTVNYKTATCNLIPDVMSVPVWNNHVLPRDKEAVLWSPIDYIDTNPYEGYVYAFHVEKYHTYIADGIITHNCIYNFTGADPNVFLNPLVSEERKTILNRSYRVPMVIQEHADRWIKKIKVREPKDQLPRIAENKEIAMGEIHRPHYSYVQGIDVADFLARKMEEYPDETFMILASCSYMLTSVTAGLRAMGIPFGNKYKRSQSSWNPLNPSRGVSGAQRLIAYLKPYGPIYNDGFRTWDHKQLGLWIDLCKANGLLKRGGKDRIKGMMKKDDIYDRDLFDMILDVFEENKFDEAMLLSDVWLERHLLDKKKKPMDYPFKIYGKYGVKGLEEEPRVLIGTIHSVKGGEADNVFLFPDISYKASLSAWESPENKEAIIRQFYVGMTRAKERLFIFNANSRLSVPI